ncbi:type II toxin-antitoxin system HicA family toxin [Megasphaera stantonii]|uniref:type II toxin-antitoxin system HicA family toxin n=1 Tax=Megasphaera stantonii TaxID=2144175 RepID=UPI0023F57743|nr:type II toxin-antitoxin system HicA family toxin [Megasphaera stantonii]
MKRRELLKLFENAGWYLKRNGGRHDVYTDGKHTEAIPRHPDINERLAKELIKRWGLK